MLFLGVLVALLSFYFLVFADGSWKWFVGIPDGLFAAATGVLVILAARRSDKRDKRDGDHGDPLPAAQRPHALAGTGLERNRSADHLAEQVLDRGAVRP